MQVFERPREHVDVESRSTLRVPHIRWRYERTRTRPVYRARMLFHPLPDPGKGGPSPRIEASAPRRTDIEQQIAILRYPVHEHADQQINRLVVVIVAEVAPDRKSTRLNSSH